MSIRNYGLISSIDELGEFIERVHGNVFGFDIETGFLGADREKGSLHPETAILVGISFTDSTDWARYVPLAHDQGENLDNYETAKLFWDLLSTGLGVAHNLAFELRHLAKWFRAQLSDDPERGEAVRASRGYYPARSDTQVEAYLAAEFQRFGLKFLTKQLFDHTMTELFELFPHLPQNKQKYLRFNTLPLEPRVVEYACEDSVWCLAIHERYYEKLKGTPLYRVEMAIVQDVVPVMEDEGVCYDWTLMRRTADQLRVFKDKFNAEIMTELSELIGQQVAINLASPKQIADTLFAKLGYRTSVYTAKTRDLPPDERRMSTGKIALERLAKKHPVVQRVREWKQITRLLGTYLDRYEDLFNYADDGRAHPSHLSAFVITGRFAVSDPPYQGSPRRYHYDLAAGKAAHEAGEEPPPGTCFKFNFRDCITAPPEHYILGFDLSQAELRAIAGEAQETALLEAFANGEDVHKKTASLMLGVPVNEITKEQRDVGKTMSFALGYGMGVKSLADRLGIPVEEAQALMDKYFSAVPNIVAWSDRQIQMGKTYGYVTSKFGRRLPIWEYGSDKRWIYQKGDRACINYPIQGAATGDAVKIGMVRAVAAVKAAGLADKIKLVMNIHDALEFYVHKSIDPQRAIAILQPAVIFPIGGWPEMKADWHIARRWGSPMEIVVNDDGSLTVKGEKVYELAPSVEEDEDGDSVEVLPEVDPEVLHEAALLVMKPRQVIVELPEMPTMDSWAAFVKYTKTMPGANEVRVVTPEGELELPNLTGLRPDHLGHVSVLFPGAQMQYAVEAIDRLAEGLTL